MAAACFILALVGWGIYYLARHLRRSARHRSACSKEINAPMRAAEAQIDKLRKTATSLDSFATPLISAINDRFFWPEILDDLNARLPKEDIWITELVPDVGWKADWHG